MDLRFWKILTIAFFVIVLTASECGTINSPPQAVIADAGGDQVVTVGETVILDGSGSSGNIVSYAWELEQRPSGSTTTLENADAVQASFIADQAGDYRVSLTVFDRERSSTEIVIITAEPVEAEGVLLEGDPATLAADAVYDLHVPVVMRDDLVSFDEQLGAEVLRTEIDIEFVDEVTVGEVNELLRDINGLIVSMVRGVPTVIVRIPDPGSLEALERLIVELEARRIVASVGKSMIQEVPVLPEGSEEAGVELQELPPGFSMSIEKLDHHLAIRGHAAWNVRNAIPTLNTRPWLVIGDFFGDGEPTDGFNIRSVAADYGSSSSYQHGYHVLGIITGAYGAGASSTDRSDVTGLFPDVLQVRAVDITDGNLTVSRTRDSLVQQINQIVDRNANARIVVNTSIGYKDAWTVSTKTRNRDARTYIKKLRSNNLEDRVIHLTAAGNADGTPTNPIRWDASESSLYTFAALGDVNNWLGARIDNLTNVLVIENRVNVLEASLQRPVPGCAYGQSIMGGHLSAIGRVVWSFGRGRDNTIPNTVPNGDSQNASDAGGTSMATPQVAGLATYIWALNPNLNSQGVVNILTNMARNDYNNSATGNAGTTWGCHTTAPQPVIDAYDAVLAAGGDAARLALLDVADSSGNAGSNGRFDEQDLTRLVSSFPANPMLDYSRFDLNGDGITDGSRGSSHTERFDLDGDQSFATLTADFLGATVTLDETALTDTDILCYYAYSSLYSGSTSERNGLLGQLCGIVDLSIVDPEDGDTFREGDVINFTVEVTIEGTHEGNVVLYTRGEEQARFANYSYLDNFPITTLSTREICPEEPTAEVVFSDPMTGLRAMDSVRLTIEPSVLSVNIAGPNPRHLRVKRSTPSGAPFIGDIELLGKASKPNCRDPFSMGVDQSRLEWLDDQSGALGTGPSLSLADTYLTDSFGRFREREVSLRYTLNGQTVSDLVTLKPCSSSIGLSPGEFAVEGYPECSLDGVIGGILEGLRDMFGTIDINDAADQVGRIINGIPKYQDVLDRLGLEPCDPRFCDPFPPEFPYSQVELRESFYGDRGTVITGYLDRLFKVLDAPSLKEFGTQLDQLLLAVAEEEALSDPDRALFVTTVSVALATADFFSPESLGGHNGWQSFGFAGDPATLVNRVDVLAPAARSVEGFLTAVVITNARTEFASDLYLHAAEYAAALEALVQSSRVATEGF